MDSEAAFGIIDQAEVLACLLDRNYVHEASGIGNVCADFAVDFDETLHHNGFGFARVESIL